MNKIHSGLLSALWTSSALLAGNVVAAEAAAPSSQAVKTDSAEPRPANCVRETGSRIKLKKDECLGIAGRSYSADELQRTGAANTGEALRRIDSSISGAR